MGQRNVRVVVGQGDQQRQGFLRTVLEDDGFDVVGEAATTSQLARLLTDEQPDVVVLDDGIGVGAVQLATEIAPTAKVIVVWPSAVVPIAGAVRVEPSEVLTTLGGTVALAAGIAGPGGIGRPEWIEKVRKDPATLREMLAARGGVPTRPSVTELQRRGHRLHPSPGAPRRSARPRPKPVAKPDKDRGAVVTPIPIAAALPTPSEESWNRRLGALALGGAAVAGALMIALAFSNRTAGFNAAGPLRTYFPTVSPVGPPSQPEGGNGPGSGPDGTANGPDGGTNGGTNTAGTTTGTGGGLETNIRGLLSGPTTEPGGNGGGGTGDGDTTGSPGGPRSNEHLPSTHANGHNGGGNQGGDTDSSSPSAPGQSSVHNPHGGPPGLAHAARPDHPGGGSPRGGGPSSHANAHARKQ